MGQKGWLFLFIILFCLTVTEAFAATVEQTIEPAGTATVDGDILPVYRVTVHAREVTGNLLSITLEEETKELCRFIEGSRAGLARDGDYLILGEDGTHYKTTVTVGPKQIRILCMSTPDVWTFTFYIMPDSVDALDQMREKAETGEMLSSKIKVGGHETSEYFTGTEPKLILTLTSDEQQLTNGDLEKLDYQLTMDENGQQGPGEEKYPIRCSFTNQIPDYSTIIVPEGVSWQMEGNDLIFTFPAGREITVSFSTIPGFEDAVIGYEKRGIIQTIATADGQSDGIRREIVYRYEEDFAVYVDVYAVNSADHNKRIRDAKFEIRQNGKTAVFSGIEAIVQTNEDGFVRLRGAKADYSGGYLWHLDKNVLYELAGVGTPQGYLPLSQSFPFMIGETRNAQNGQYRSGDSLLIPYTQGVEFAVEGTYTLAGREMQPEETRSFELNPVSDTAEDEQRVQLPSLRTASVSGSSVSGKFAFDPMTFLEPGIYEFQITQMDLTPQGITHESERVRAEITVEQNNQTGGLFIASTKYSLAEDGNGNTSDELVLRDTYAATGEAVITGIITVDGGVPGDEELYVVLKQGETEIDRQYCQPNGEFSFAPIPLSRDASGKPHEYLVCAGPLTETQQKSGMLPEIDSCPVSFTVTDNGKGKMEAVFPTDHPVQVSYRHDQTLIVNVRAHQLPPSLSELTETLVITVDAQIDEMVKTHLGTVEATVSGTTEGTKTIYKCTVEDGMTLELPVPLRTEFHLAFAASENGGSPGFTYLDNTYQTSEVDGWIGNCVPRYEALMIYPHGTYKPETQIRFLTRSFEGEMPAFLLRPADEATGRAVQEGWITLPGGRNSVSGTAGTITDGLSTISFADGTDSIVFQKAGEYTFEVIAEHDDKICFINDRTVLSLKSTEISADVLEISETGEKRPMVCYVPEHLVVSINEGSQEESHWFELSFEHEGIDFDQMEIQMIKNGDALDCVLQKGQGEIQLRSGDELRFSLPRDTTYHIEPILSETSLTELTLAQQSDPILDTLDTERHVRFNINRKEASVRLDTHLYDQQGATGTLRVSFFESEGTDEALQDIPVRITRNGKSVSLENECMMFGDGDTIILSGPLNGLRCRIEAKAFADAISLIDVNSEGYQEMKQATVQCRADIEQTLSLAQTLVSVQPAGTVEMRGETLKADCLEVVIEGYGNEAKETIQCPESATGSYEFTGTTQALPALGRYTFTVRQNCLSSLPRTIMDKSRYTLTMSVVKGENGKVYVDRMVTRTNEEGRVEPVNEIRFTNITLCPVQIACQTIDGDKPVKVRIRTENTGTLSKFAYTAGTQSGQMVSGDTLSLLNETATIWLPFGSEYDVEPVQMPGYKLSQGENESLRGTVELSQTTMHITGRYEPVTVFTEASVTHFDGIVELNGGIWTDEKFTVVLEPADENTKAAEGTGYRFIGGTGSLEYQTEAEKPDYAILLLSSDEGEHTGIQALKQGRYTFRISQVAQNLTDIVQDIHTGQIVLDVSDDGEGHLSPQLSGNQSRLIFRNDAQARLRVVCTVEESVAVHSDHRAYEQRLMPFTISITEHENLSVTVLKRHGEQITESTEHFVDGIMTLELCHGDTIEMTELPSGSAFTVRTESSPGYSTKQETYSGTLMYRSPAECLFPFTYEPEGQATVSGIVRLLYRQAEDGEEARFVLTPGDEFTREVFGDAFRLEASVPLGKGRQQSLAGQSESEPDAFVFEPLIFQRTGTYVFDLFQTSEHLPNMTYDESRYQARIIVSDPEPGSGVLTTETEILLEGTKTAASFANAYVATGRAVISGEVQLFERQMRTGEFTFRLLDEEGKVIGACINRDDGSFSFEPIEYTASDIGCEQSYRVLQISRHAGGMAYDTQEYRAVVSVRDTGSGELSVSTAYSGKETGNTWTSVNKVQFENHYTSAGALEIEAKLRILGRPFLLGEIYELHLLQKTDGTDWIEIDTRELSPEGKKRTTVTFDELEYMLSDVEDSPIEYMLRLDYPDNPLLGLQGAEERVFQVELTDMQDGTLIAESSLSENDDEFVLMAYTEQTIDCEWDDNNDVNGIRPKSIAVKLLANGEETDRLVLTDENGWRTSTGLLPLADQNGRNISYSMEIVKAKPYGLTMSGNDVDGYTIVARYRPHYETNKGIMISALAPDTGDMSRTGPALLMFTGALIGLILLWIHRKNR